MEKKIKNENEERNENEKQLKLETKKMKKKKKKHFALKNVFRKVCFGKKLISSRKCIHCSWWLNS